jgi:hypothetical protein
MRGKRKRTDISVMPPKKEAKLVHPTKFSKRRLVTFSSPTEASIALAMNYALLR